MANLFFYYSAMNAGKTTTLLQSSYNYRERGMRTLLFLPDFDSRGGAGKISSRIGLQADACTFSKTFNFYEYVRQQTEMKDHNIRCVMVDEAQFLTKDQVYQLTEVVDQLKIPVLCYGLRTDYLGELFEGSKYLLAWAEKISEIKTICHCGRKASMVARVDENGVVQKEGNQVEIGGNDRYVSMCRKHYKMGLKDELKPEVFQFVEAA